MAELEEAVFQKLSYVSVCWVHPNLRGLVAPFFDHRPEQLGLIQWITFDKYTVPNYLLGVNPLVDTNFSWHFDAFWFLDQSGNQNSLHPAILQRFQVTLFTGRWDKDIAGLLLAFLLPNCYDTVWWGTNVLRHFLTPGLRLDFFHSFLFQFTLE